MVYFLSSEDAESTYRDWLCAGALISTSHVLTAAACLTDVSRLYVIAGYKKYVNAMDVDKDNCTSKRKRRVIRICTPKSYNLNFGRVSDWMKIDIGIATVDEPYNFDDQTFRLECSYPPDKIDINYDPYLQKDDTSAIVMGWGSIKRFREDDDVVDHNSEYLQYARIRLKPIDRCLTSFTNHSGAAAVIKEFMICSGSAGWFNIDGKEVKGVLPHHDGCKTEPPVEPTPVDFVPNKEEKITENPSSVPSNSEEYESEEIATTGVTEDLSTLSKVTSTKLSDKYKINDGESDYFDWRRAWRRGSGYHGKVSSYENESDEDDITKPGFCQNDHGAPLVAWSGTREYVIGVASACLVKSETRLCMPPFLYTSTYCTGLFLQCVLSGSANSEIRRKCAEIAKDNGISIEDNAVAWPGDTESKQPQQGNPNDMKAQDYEAVEEIRVTPKPILRSNIAVESPPKSESIEMVTVVNSPDDPKESTTEDPIETMFNHYKAPERKILVWLEPRTNPTVTEGEFDPYAILQEELADDNLRNIEKDDVTVVDETTHIADTYDPQEIAHAESTANSTEKKTGGEVLSTNNRINKKYT